MPVPELITLGAGARAVVRHLGGAALHRPRQGDARGGRGRADRRRLRRQPAALSLLLAGICAALAGVAGVCIALSFTLAPSQIYAWIGVVFAAVMMGGLGSALGPLVAGMVIGVSEALTMAVTAPSWAPMVSFTLLIADAAAAAGQRAA